MSECKNTKVIFKDEHIDINSANLEKKDRIPATGCECAMRVHGDGDFTVTVETVSQQDPYYRPCTVVVFNNGQDPCVMPLANIKCGMDILFTLRGPSATAPADRIFVELYYETPCDKPCCAC